MTEKLTAIGVDYCGHWRTNDVSEQPFCLTWWTTVDTDELLGANPVCATSPALGSNVGSYCTLHF
jgi:hypothetical protein